MPFCRQLPTKTSPNPGPTSARTPKSSTAYAAPSRDESAAKIDSCHKNAGALIRGTIEHEFLTRSVVLVEAQIV
jgi:hypothetical protein